MNDRICLRVGALLGGLAVALGAFGAHLLPKFLNQVDADALERSLVNWNTAAQYQMYHALALLLVGILQISAPSRGKRLAAGFFLAGVLIFSGALYALVLLQQRWLGAVVPVGGTCFLIGWAILARSVTRGS